MAEISFNESDRQIRAINDRVREGEKAKDWGGAIAGLHELLDHPCANHQVVAYEVWDNIHELHKRAGDYDAAIAAKQQAVQAGYRSEPHPDADIAECHLLAGRRAEADRLFADLRARTPDDVWLYNAAGFSYAGVSDHAESARWFREGIDVALRTGDADQVVIQLLEGLEAAWKALGESPEPGLHERVEALVEAWKPPPRGDRFNWDDLPPLVERRCEHCGYDPDILKGSMARRVFETMPEPTPPRQASRLPSSMLVSLAWFPPGEWEKATALYPPRRRHGVPPGRNVPCWCGSGRKYKACCGPVPPAPE